MIWEGWRPILIRFSAWLRSYPAKVTVKLVASPHSSSCILQARTSILAAGCWTSNWISDFLLIWEWWRHQKLQKSCRYGSQPFFWDLNYLKSFKNGKMRKHFDRLSLSAESNVERDYNILLQGGVLPLGPSERLILALISLQALMFLSTTSSKPEKCLCP